MFNKLEGRMVKRDPNQAYLIEMLTNEENIFKCKRKGENEY